MNERAVWCGSRFLLAGAQQLSELANKHWSQKDHARAAARAALAHDLTAYLDQGGGVIFRAVRLAAGEALECVVDRGAIMDLCNRLRKMDLLHPSSAVHLCRFLAKRLRRIESTTRVPRRTPATAAELRAAGKKHSGTTWQDRLEVEEVQRIVLVVLGVPATRLTMEEQDALERHEGASRIQGLYRARKAKEHVGQQRAARKIQSCQRAKLGRRRAVERKAEIIEERIQHRRDQVKAATKIQAAKRARDGRAKAEEKRDEHRAATTIQARIIAFMPPGAGQVRRRKCCWGYSFADDRQFMFFHFSRRATADGPSGKPHR